MTVQHQIDPVPDAHFEIEDVQWPWDDLDLNPTPPIGHEPALPSSEIHRQGPPASVAGFIQPSNRTRLPAHVPNISPSGRHDVASHSTTAVHLGASVPSLPDVWRSVGDTLDQLVQKIETRLSRVETLLVRDRADNVAGVETGQRSIKTVDKKVNQTVERVNKLFHSLKEVQGRLPLQTRREMRACNKVGGPA